VLSHSTDQGAARRILLASFHFPPDAAVGGLRIAKFARHLAEAGWEPYVLTARDDLKDSGFDPDRCAGLERITVVKTGELPRWINRMARVKSAIVGRSRPAAASADGESERHGETATAKLMRYAVSLLGYLPDDRKNWSAWAAVVAVRLIRKYRVRWVLTSGPPFSGHLIGVVAKAATGAKWVADFRDPWIDMLNERWPQTRTRLSDAIERRMESVVVRLADRVVVTTERMKDAMSVRYPGVPSERFVSIPNGIDSDRIRETSQSYDRLTVTYAGSLYFDRTPEPLFAAVSHLIETSRATRDDIRIQLLGDCQDVNGEEIGSLIRRYGLVDVVSVSGRIPHADIIEIMRRSHVLLVLAPERHRLVVPAKIYDYLGTGRIVLALAAPGATADLMKETQCGPCFAPDDVQGLSNYLAGLLEGRRFETARNPPERFARYTARTLTARLALEMERADGHAHEVLAGT
jgi:glycosyltransferase involved in cell wall biosynthesis